MHTAINLGTSTDLPARMTISSQLEWAPGAPPVRIGVALRGGFARGIAHVGVRRICPGNIRQRSLESISVWPPQGLSAPRAA